MPKKLLKKYFLSPPFLNGMEKDYLDEALNSNWIAPVGPQLKMFELEVANYLGMNHSLALSSGTAALHLALKVLGINKNDEVFCSDLTFAASAFAIKYVEAKPIFIDSEFNSWNMCPKSLEKAFAFHCPKAVIVTDIYGQSANYSLIAEICKKNNVPIIEDAAESLGATYKNKKCGSFGDLSILSFNGNKIITTSGGGMLLSNDENLIKKAKKLSNQAKENTIYYQHNEIGYNYRLSNVLAALGRAQFNSLDNFVRKKRNIFKNYKSLFCKQKFIQFMPEIEKGVSTNWLSVILVNRQKIDIMKIIAEIIDNNIEVRPLWKPMHMQPIFKNSLYYKFETSSVSKTLFYHGICLPSGLSLTLDNQIEISNIILSAIEKN